MPKKASKAQLLDWEKRLVVQMHKAEIVQQLSEQIDEELEVIKSEMKGYGMVEWADEDIQS